MVARGANGYLTPKIRKEILDEGCHWCGGVASEVDHIIPVSRGGSNDRENLVGACHDCNHEKLDLMPEEWETYRRSKGYPWPPPSIFDFVEYIFSATGDYLNHKYLESTSSLASALQIFYISNTRQLYLSTKPGYGRYRKGEQGSANEEANSTIEDYWVNVNHQSRAKLLSKKLAKSAAGGKRGYAEVEK